MRLPYDIIKYDDGNTTIYNNRDVLTISIYRASQSRLASAHKLITPAELNVWSHSVSLDCNKILLLTE